MDENYYAGIADELLEGHKERKVVLPEVSKEALSRNANEMLTKGYLPNESSIAALEAYMMGFNLWLSGDVGTGKTFFFRAAPVFIPPSGCASTPRRVFVDMATDFEGMELSEIREYLYDHRFDELVLDDVGNEGTVNSYGNRREILPFILSERSKVGPCTHLTTNHEKKFFDERYGYGFFDRLRSSAFFVKFRGISRRVLTPHLNHRKMGDR